MIIAEHKMHLTIARSSVAGSKNRTTAHNPGLHHADRTNRQGKVVAVAQPHARRGSVRYAHVWRLLWLAPAACAAAPLPR